jgi:hypothetical protein
VTWHYQRALGTCCRPYHAAAEHTPSPAYRRWILVSWRQRRDHAIHRWQASPIRANLLCIHQGEGAWDDPAAPYYGGLQMDTSFMAAYAPTTYLVKGTADHWTPLEQLTAGARAVRVRGYSPWPQTRIPCGV